MNHDWFNTLRNMTTFFAAVMLFKYYVFLLFAPFHPVKEALRQYRLKKARIKNKTAPYHPKVSVIVPAWNEEVGVLKTVNSIVANTYNNTEIIIVNDGSTDNSHAIIQAYIKKQAWKQRNPGVSIRYFYKENGGKGTALNYGIKASTGEIILTVDADSVVDKHAITRLVSYFEDPTIDAAVGNVKVSRNNSMVGFIQTLEYLFGFYYKRAHSVMGAEYIFGGACAAFRKSSTFDRIGLFDDVNKTEDIEMSLRTRYNGLKSVYAEDVVCYTEGASTVIGLMNQRLRWKKGRFDTFAKYRRLFFSLDKRHNRFLSWLVLPYSLLSELQLLFEPIGFTLLAAYSVISGDYLSIALGILFIFVIYLVNAFFNSEKIRFELILLFPLSWPLFYVLVWIEYVALMKSLVMILRGDEVEWQKWQRQGVTEATA
jgi:cellulose synthase/poly-beta-1,6-N-acetylglucosamine synthase-like glycosyltransferase